MFLVAVPLRVSPALLCRVEHQCQELSGRPGGPPGAADPPATRRAAAVPGGPDAPGGSPPVHRSAGGKMDTTCYI